MRHVLIIHYHFLPVHNVAVRHLLGYTRRMVPLGWQPHVLTRAWNSVSEAAPSWGLSWEPALESGCGAIIHRVSVQPPARRAPARVEGEPTETLTLRTPATRAFAKLKRVVRLALGPYPDEFIGWTGPAIREGRRISRAQPFDAILSYCPPESNHVVGRRLATELSIPWVALFGDLYGFLEAPLPRRSIEGWYRRRWHDRCLRPAAACIGISPAMVAYLGKRYGKPAHLLHAGFDPADFASASGPDFEKGRFVISHVGSLYPGDQEPEQFFDGLDLLLAENPDVASNLHVRFVGSKCDDYLHALLHGRPSERICTILPRVDSTQAIAYVRSSHVLLAFTCRANRDRFGTMSYPTKVFEALGARRPVLAIPADHDWLDSLLAETGGGCSASTPAEIAGGLRGWYRTWERDGVVRCASRPDALDEYTMQHQTERLVAVLQSVSEAPR